MSRLEGKVICLTGGGAGIAKATARACAREGAAVALFDIDREVGAAAARQIDAEGGRALFVHTDVTQDDSVREAIAQTVARFGRLDVLFNCAGGSSQDDRPVHDMDLDVWHRTIALNLLHPFLMCRHGLPHLMQQRSGSIINVTSHLGLVGSVKPAYAATKGGIISFTKTLAAQYAAFGIRANAIAPGSVRTERAIGRYEGQVGAESPAARERATFHKLYPFSKGEPEDIAAIALFLASDESRMLTGTTIAADGGRSSYLKVYAAD
ncbi:MAG: SDR family oxidoreductase [Proteobacteria bacterium]|nr:SDR family oxidoreductase [Burkholderiales bacterium]